MVGAGTVINPLIKIITTVVILGAVYLFIVKPALDTTNNAFDSFSESFNGFDNLPGHVQTQIDNALGDTDVDTVNVGNWAFGIEGQGFAEGAFCVPPAEPAQRVESLV